MCIRCRDAEAPEPLGFCPACALHTRTELSAGFRQLDRYLAAWAGFADWLEQRRPDAPKG